MGNLENININAVQKQVNEVEEIFKNCLNKYGLDNSIGKAIFEENKNNAEEFNKDLDKYFLDNSTTFNIINNYSLLEHYFNFMINHPNEWIVISNVLKPFEKESNDLLFEIIQLLKDTKYNFERKYNKLRIIK